jgi:hypothetical protein
LGPPGSGTCAQAGDARQPDPVALVEHPIAVIIEDVAQLELWPAEHGRAYHEPEYAASEAPGARAGADSSHARQSYAQVFVDTTVAVVIEQVAGFGDRGRADRRRWCARRCTRRGVRLDQRI